jgi:hypothetical protein
MAHTAISVQRRVIGGMISTLLTAKNTVENLDLAFFCLHVWYKKAGWYGIATASLSSMCTMITLLVVALASSAWACPGPVSLGTGLSLLTHNDLYGELAADRAELKARLRVVSTTVDPCRLSPVSVLHRRLDLCRARRESMDSPGGRFLGLPGLRETERAALGQRRLCQHNQCRPRRRQDRLRGAIAAVHLYQFGAAEHGGRCQQLDVLGRRGADWRSLPYWVIPVVCQKKGSARLADP